VRKYIFDFRRRDGSWQQLCRMCCFREESSVVLPYCPERGTILLTRQFRLPVFTHGRAEGMLIEAPGGLVDGKAPAEAACLEAEEETGIRVRNPRKIFAAYMSPALLTEWTHFFVAEFCLDDRISGGGGLCTEGEDIEVLELALDQALAMIESGEIADGKTITLLLYAKLKGLLG
jgi:nudix-type nucleoside diphosphatase (YffH/AdpP family)